MVFKTKSNHDFIQAFCRKYGYSISIKKTNFSKVEGEDKFHVCIFYAGVSTTNEFRENLSEYFKGKAISNGGVVNTLGRIIVENQKRKR